MDQLFPFLYRPAFWDLIEAVSIISRLHIPQRNDTATIEVDELELTRLILEGKNINYESLPASRQSLSFLVLENKAKQEIGIESLHVDVLKTLNLYSDSEGYNHAAELLADENHYPGIDVARFGESISIILKRATFKHESVLV